MTIARIERRRFREEASSRELLAIDPKAFTDFFDIHETEETEIKDGVAVVSISGPLEHHTSWCWDSYDAITRRIGDAFANEESRAIVLCIDSPGGDAAGMVEAHRRIRRMRAEHGKPIYAYANERAASAAYGLACAADEIWLPETGHLGSIGVIATVVDASRAHRKAGVRIEYITTGARKADGQPGQELTSETLEAFRGQVDAIGDSFFEIVASSRGLSVDAIKALEAGTFLGESAVQKGIADGVAGWDEFIAFVRKSTDGARFGSTANSASTVKTAAKSTGLARMAHSGSTVAKQGGTTPAKETSMTKLLSLIKARDEAKASMLGARTKAEREKLLVTYEKAALAVATAQAAEASTKSAKTYKKEEISREEVVEDDEDEEEDDEDAESSESEEDEDEDAEASDASDDEDDDCEDEDAEAASKSTKSAKGLKGLYSDSRLFRLASQITGKGNRHEVFGALAAMGKRLKDVSRLEASVKKIQTERRSEKVEAMLSKAKADGRITRAQIDTLRAQGTANAQGYRFLKGFLATSPKRLRTMADGERMPSEAEGVTGSHGLSSDQIKMAKATALSLGKPVEEVIAELATTNKKQLNGKAPTY